MAAGGLDEACGRLGVLLFLGKVRDRDIGTLACVCDRDRPSDPRIAAGDEGAPAGEPAGTPVRLLTVVGSGVRLLDVSGLGSIVLRKRVGAVLGPGVSEMCAHAGRLRPARLSARGLDITGDSVPTAREVASTGARVDGALWRTAPERLRARINAATPPLRRYSLAAATPTCTASSVVARAHRGYGGAPRFRGRSRRPPRHQPSGSRRPSGV